MADGTGSAMRADAQRNRERILDAAAIAFARDRDAALSAIGKLAGIGQGTLYRHFPDREALLWAVYEREVDDLVGHAGELLATATPREALRAWMSHLARFAQTKAGLGAAMSQAIDGNAKAARPGYARVVRAIEALLVANKATGDVRSDVTAQDFTSLIAGLWQIGPGEEGEARAQRIVDLVIIAVSSEIDSVS